MRVAPEQVSPLRRYGTAALLAGCAVHMAALSMVRGAPLTTTVLGAGALGAAAVAAANTKLLPQVFARAVSWLLFAPAALAALLALSTGRSPLESLPFAMGAGMALLAGAPLLHTKEAHDPFAPVRFRKTWIASATASIAAAVATGALAVAGAYWGEWLPALGATALAVALAASARAVLQMRGYGVVLGAATSIAAFVAGLATGFPPLLLAALPGVMMVAPIFLSRLVPEAEETDVTEEPRVRVQAPLRVAAVEAEAATDAADVAIETEDDTAATPAKRAGKIV